jgi:dipeptidyl aminopeptidase/acylaminoacyl peptidase
LAATVFIEAKDAHARSQPPHAFVSDPDYSHPMLSPSGLYLAVADRIPSSMSDIELNALREKENKTEEEARRLVNALTPNHRILIYDLEANDRPQYINMGGVSVAGIRWASDSRLLITVALPFTTRYYGFSFIQMSQRILSVDISTKEAVVLFDSQRARMQNNLYLSSISSMLPDDPDHILMPAARADDLDLWKVNIISGKAERVEKGGRNTFAWAANEDGRPVFRLDKNRRGTEMYVYTKDAKGKWRRRAETRLRRDNSEPVNFQPLAPDADGKNLYMLARVDGEDRKSVKVFDVLTGEITGEAYANARYDVSSGVSDYITGEYLGATYYDERLTYALEDKTLQKHIKAVSAFFDDKVNVVFENISKRSNVMLVKVSGPRFPGEYYVYNVQRRELRPLFTTHPNLLYEDLSPVEHTTYAARDGTPIPALITHPHGDTTSHAPLIVMPHGGPEARDVYGYDATVQFLANIGFRVLQPNFRGSSGYGKAYAEAGYGEWGGAMQDDVTDGVRWLIGRGLASKGDICIVGSSYGGYAALMGVIKTPDLYACAVSLNGVTDLDDLARHELREADNGSFHETYIKASIGNPYRDGERLRSRSPARLADVVSAPVLIVHGKADSIVPFAQAEKMAEALKAANKPYETLFMENVGHHMTGERERIDYLYRLEVFLNRHLRPERVLPEMTAPSQ